ncbi:MAG: class I SAM-dependent methyltransferase [Solirubrobacteraceae bacterium]
MCGEFAGATASFYAQYRRDVPDTLIGAAVRAADLTGRDVVLDLGCGTGQVALALCRHVSAVLAVDPEPHMLAGLRARLASMRVANVLPVLAADRDLTHTATVWGGSLGAVTVANALHWMDSEHVFAQCRALLRVGGALIIISQGPPMWLSDSAWSRDLRVLLEQWTGGAASAMCGTDHRTLQERALGLRQHGYETVEIVEHAYENEVDLPYIAGHLCSAMSESTLPAERAAEFEAGLTDALRPHVHDGPLIERIEATALIGIAQTASGSNPIS